MPSLLTLPDLPFDDLESTLAESVETISKEAEALVLGHIRNHIGSDGAEEWLEQGLGFVDAVCPFCGQASDGIPLIDAYRHYFDKAYASLKARVLSEAASWDEALGDKFVEAIAARVTENAGVALAWADHAEIAFPEAPDVVGICHRVRASVATAYQAKAGSLVDEFAPSRDLKEARAEWDDLATTVSRYNESITEINQTLVSIQAAAAQADIKALRDSLGRLEARQHRSGLNAECSKYQKLTQEKSRLAQKKQRLQDQLSASSKAFLLRYGDAVNKRLKAFRAGFRLADFARSYAGDGVARAAYGLVVQGHPVPLTAKTGKADFATTLSDGDKRLLALALFLARLDVDQGMREHTVVFDDPVCSFDIYRRETAAQVLAELVPSLGQVIVLSHDPELVHLLDQCGFEQTLQIRATGQGCVLEQCDIGEVCKDPYVTHYSVLTAFKADGAPAERLRSISESIRPYLEANLRHRFPLELEKCRNLGEMIHRIRECSEDNPLSVLKGELDDLQQVSDFAAAPHHADPDAERIDERELQTTVSQALKIGWN